MSNNRSVYYSPERGKWVNKRDGNDSASSLHDTQSDAYNAARDMLKKSGGGDVSVHRKDTGQIRDKNTIGKPDPFPPEG